MDADARLRKAGVVVTAANDNTDVLDVSGAMQLLRLGRHAIYDGVARNIIPHRRIGKHIRFSKAALLRWLDSNQRESDAGATRS